MAARGIKTDRRAVWVFVRSGGPGSKKGSLGPSKIGRDVARKRQRWKTRQHRIDPERPRPFLDETWVKTNMASLRGSERQGEGAP